jgi:hypothetical protein
MGLVQEKFQIDFPVPSADNQWVSDKSVRRQEGRKNLNEMPPGTNISDQQLADTTTPVRVMSGETDVTKDWSPSYVHKGFRRFDLKPTDDSYTAEHTDTFYGDAVSDGETGFIERGNLLDRI